MATARYSKAKPKTHRGGKKVTKQKLEVNISKAQRDYLRGVRKWLGESSEDKSVIVGGPIK